ncbi:glycosyltransferase [Microbacterium sp. KSW2-21]|uniref:Glycosyltransferase n=1 Tax=Microbacterium algihabitans TaxID=3075992 RepID=A0ABU3RVL0_9MICO|nr:glycosyltransferase [Microbacterium sp. KSW2-21]MDU0326864.1 glycosyltransferase [Microbacterium sp. KSW2-21]
MKGVKAATDGFRVDLLLAIKTIYFNQRMLLEIPAAKRVHYSFDDVSNRRNLSSGYLRHEKLWDLIGTTKQHNVMEIEARGGNPLFQWAAYDPRLHKRETDFLDRKYAIGFVGAMREDREGLPDFMAHASGRDNAVIAGPRWNRRYPDGHPGIDMLPAQMGPAYTRLANDVQGGLVLLNSENRDQHTNRSIETPATGQLVIAEDTEEHRQLFSDGTSALLFSSLSEAAERIREMRHDRHRASRIAQEGYRRISAGGFTYKDRASELLRWSRNT